MSDPRVSSVIQEWGSSYPGQVHGQVLSSSNQGAPTNQMSPMDMMSYSQCQGLMRGGAEDREQVAFLSYTSGSGGSIHQLNAQQVSSDAETPSTSCLVSVKQTSPLGSRTSPPSCCRPSGPPSPRGSSARTAPSTAWDGRRTTSPWGRAGTRPGGGSCWPSRGPCSCRRRTRSCRSRWDSWARSWTPWDTSCPSGTCRGPTSPASDGPAGQPELRGSARVRRRTGLCATDEKQNQEVVIGAVSVSEISHELLSGS